jgi:hypothetical protein
LWSSAGDLPLQPGGQGQGCRAGRRDQEIARSATAETEPGEHAQSRMQGRWKMEKQLPQNQTDADLDTMS